MSEPAPAPSVPSRAFRLQTVATVTSTIAAVIASATAVIASVQATRAIQDQARMALFQRQVDACIDYSKSARAFTQSFNVAVAYSLMRLRDDEPSPEKDKMFMDTITKAQEGAAALVDGTDNVRLVVPDQDVRTAVESGHQQAIAVMDAWRGGMGDAAKLSKIPDQNIALEAQFEKARLACRTYLGEVMSGRQGIR